MPRKDATALSTSNAQAQQDAVSEGIDAYELPKSLVTRLARSALPENAKLQKDVVLALTKGSTVFVNYLAATAHDIAAQKQHKSVSASDVLKALEEVEMGDVIPKLQQDLQAYRANQKSKKASPTKPILDNSLSVGKTKLKVDASTPDSLSTSAVKGKEKAVITIPSRAALSSAQNPAQTQTAEVSYVKEDKKDGEVHDEEMIDVEENEIDEMDDEELGDEYDEDDVGDEEDIVDRVVVEDVELRRDTKGVEVRDSMDEDE